MVGHYLLQALITLVTNKNSLIFLITGSLVGLLAGVIPGLGGPVIMSIVVAFAFRLTVEEVTSLFLAVLAGSYYSASITSILLNTPAHPEAFAVTFDGFPMAQRGEAGRALGISASSTLIGGLIGCAVLIGLLQFINQLSVAFHPPEYVALISLALILVSTLGTDSSSKALTSAGLGIVFASVGESYITGAERYTFNSLGLLSGIDLIALVLGMLAIPQMVLLFGSATKVAKQDMLGREVGLTAPAELGRDFRNQSIQGAIESFRHLSVVIRSACIGVITGVVPGIGGFAANFLSYSVTQQLSKKRKHLFGSGISEGIIAAEGSSLAKEAGGLIPLLSLGIPGGVGSALLLVVLALKNVDPGYGFVKHYPVLTYEMVWIIAIGGLIGTIGGLLLTPTLAQITRVPGICIVPLVMSLVVIGTFAAEGSIFVVGEMAVFVIVGFALRRLRYSLPAVVIGLVLGTTFESNVYLTIKVFPGFSFLWRQPFADLIFIFAIAALVWKAVDRKRELGSRAKFTDKATGEVESTIGSAFVESPAVTQSGSTSDKRTMFMHKNRVKPSSSSHPESENVDYGYPLLAVLTNSLLITTGVFVLAYGLFRYDKATFLMPAIGASALTVGSAWRFPSDVRSYFRYHKMKRSPQPGESRDVGRQKERSTGPSHFKLLESPRQIYTKILSFFALGKSAEELPQIEDNSWGKDGQYTREVAGILWFVGLIVACYLFGFLIGVVVFLFAFGIIATRRAFNTLGGRIIFAVVSAVVMGLLSNIILVDLLHLAYLPLINL